MQKKNKLIIVTSYLNEKSGWGRYSLGMLEQLTKNNFDIVVICHKKNNELSNLKQVAILPEPLSLRKNQLLAFFIVLKLFFTRNSFIKDADFTHCFVEPYSFFTYLLSKVLHIKYYITIHGSYGIKGFDNWLYRIIQLFSYKKAKVVFCVSNYSKNRVLEYNKKLLNKMEIIPNGVDDSIFSRSLNGRKENIILGVGGLKKRKGYDIVIKALRIVKKHIPDIKYIIIGEQKDVNFLKYLKKLIGEYNLEKNVVFYENIPDNELNFFYNKAKLFVLTPVSDQFNFEGFGLVYIEANAHGVPVIGSYGNGGEDAIKNNFNGFLTKAGDYQDIADNIIKILTDDTLYSNISKNALEWSKNLLWDNIFKEYLKVYEK